jgi:hypothetical protein
MRLKCEVFEESTCSYYIITGNGNWSVCTKPGKWAVINFCHTSIENLSDPIGYLLDFTNPYYTALAGNMKARAKKDNSFLYFLSRNTMGPYYLCKA